MGTAVRWAAGAVMGVGSLLPIAGAACERRHDGISILIPGLGAAVSAVYRTEDGRERKAFVRAPMVAVIPCGEDCQMECLRPADTLLLKISTDFFEEHA